MATAAAACAVAAAVGVLLPAGPAFAQTAGRTLYVSAAGSDSTGDGSSGRPFRQIRRAVSVVTAGDKILVGDGTYLGFDVRDKRGDAFAPITIQATGSAANIVPTTDRSDNRDTIFVTDSSYVVLDGLRSGNANRAALRVSLSDHVTVRRGVFGNNGAWGIFTDFADDLVLERNECFGSRLEHGIYVSNDSERPLVRGNILYGNTRAGLHLNSDAAAGGDGIITGAVIENNLVYNNGSGGAAGINMDGVQDSVVRNNLLYGNRATGIACYQITAGGGPKGLQILNNTVDMPTEGRWALLMKQTAGPNLLRNNILLHRNSGRGAIEYGAWSDVANTDSDYNVLDRVTPDDGGSFYTLSQWKAQGKETHSLSATPAALFADPTTGNYRLAAGSPAIDRGVNLPNAATDFDGASRPAGAGTDIGCYEAGAPATPPPTPTPTPAPLAAPENLRVVGTTTTSLYVQWNERAIGETGYQVQVSRDGGATWRGAGRTGSNVSEYTVGGLTRGTRYLLRARAFRTTSTGTTYSPFSNTASGTTRR